MKANKRLYLVVLASIGLAGGTSVIAQTAGGTATPPPVTTPPGGTIVPGPTLPPRTPPGGTLNPANPPGGTMNPVNPPGGTLNPANPPGGRLGPGNPGGPTPQNPGGPPTLNPGGVMTRPVTPANPVNPNTANGQQIQNQALTPNDRIVLNRIGQSLRNINGMNQMRVNFLVQNGYVTLVGTVPTQGAAQQLEARIARVPGVLGVNDQLQVTGQANTGFFNDTRTPGTTAPAIQPNQVPATPTPQ